MNSKICSKTKIRLFNLFGVLLMMGQVAQAARGLATSWMVWVQFRVAEGLPLSSTVAVNMWTLASSSPWAFMACNGDNFIFTVYF